MAKDRRTKDQKRKAKLAERNDRRGQQDSLAYQGSKYKTEELVPVHLRTEVGIFESFVISDRKLTDQAVEQALTEMVLKMRNGTLPPATKGGSVADGEPPNLVIWNIQRNWQDLFRTQPNPGMDNLIGVLRTILNSIELWKSPGPGSTGYLRYLEGFLQKVGYRFDVYDQDSQPVEEPEVPLLLQLGREWIKSDDRTQAAFEEKAEDMIESGSASIVIDVCQQLLGEMAIAWGAKRECQAALMALSLRARQSLVAAMG